MTTPEDLCSVCQKPAHKEEQRLNRCPECWDKYTSDDNWRYVEDSQGVLRIPKEPAPGDAISFEFNEKHPVNGRVVLVEDGRVYVEYVNASGMPRRGWVEGGRLQHANAQPVPVNRGWRPNL